MLSPRERCLRELGAIEHELRSGNVDLSGLLLALRDWRTELAIIDGTQRTTTTTDSTQDSARESR